LLTPLTHPVSVLNSVGRCGWSTSRLASDTTTLMKPSIIILGTNHRLQAGASPYSSPQLKIFSDLIVEIIKKYRIRLITEELSEDALPDYGVMESIAKQVANQKNIKHEYIDLSRIERENLKIDRLSLYQYAQSSRLNTPQYLALEKTASELRECIWLVRILGINTWPALFICGANHGSRIEYLFNTIGKTAILEVNDYEASSIAQPESQSKEVRRGLA
jgi:hypothetical protein